MKGICFLFICTLAGLKKSSAQLNESDTIKLQLRASITGNYQHGNVEVLNIRTKFDLSYSPHKNWAIKSQNSSLYQAFFATKADNDIFSRNYFYYKPQQNFYPFVIAYVSANFRRKIDHRYFAGAGLTWQAISSHANILKLSASVVYEETKFIVNRFNVEEYNGKNDLKLWRGTLYLGGWTYLSDRTIRLYYDGYWQPGFKNNKNYRIQADIGFEIPVWKGLSFNTLYSFTHENVVAGSVKQEDQLLTFGMAYQLKLKGKPQLSNSLN